MISSGPKWPIEKNFSQQAILTKTKVFNPFFLVVSSSVTNIKEQKIRLQKLFWHLFWNLKEFVSGFNRLLKKESFEKKATFPVMKNFWPTFPLIIAHDICQATTHRGPKVVLTKIVQRIKKLFGTWEVNRNQTFQKKAVFKMTKDPFSSYHRVWQTSGINI